MKKLALITSLGALTLVAAAPPSHWNRGASSESLTGGGYPPCSRTVVDRCIQLYERGVATAANLSLNKRLGPDRPNVGLAAVQPLPAPHSDDDDYAFAEPTDRPAAGYWNEPADEWASEDEYAALEPEDDYYGY
jgi:hypothetical protein